MVAAEAFNSSSVPVWVFSLNSPMLFKAIIKSGIVVFFKASFTSPIPVPPIFVALGGK